MCGIIGAVSNRDIVPTLVDSMRIMEYRGYDSAGIAVINSNGEFDRERCVGKVEKLVHSIQNGSSISGTTGIGHTRWATHGPANEANAHPLISSGRVAVVCNGIIENYEELRHQHLQEGSIYDSATDTEVILHELMKFLDDGLGFLDAVKETVKRLIGSYAFAALCISEPGKIIVAKRGCPLLIGFGDNETFIASDAIALAKIAKSIIVLENGDIAEISGVSETNIIDQFGEEVKRKDESILIQPKLVDLAHYSHYMQKEIFEQGSAVANTLEERITNNCMLEIETFEVEAVRILACGTSYYAGMVARIWLESMGIPCEAEIASEFRYRNPVVPDNALVVAISQSGETADTLAALNQASKLGYKYSLAICNSPFSQMTRVTDLVLHTRAGPEISVASTKAFTTQLVSLLLLMIALAKRRAEIVSELRALPSRIEALLQMDKDIAELSDYFADKEHTLFLGRGTHYPIALEGALKLKEISYIHADAYPAGELKHGPLALIDAKTPTIAVAPNNHLLAKLKANIQEVRARGGKLFVFSDSGTPIKSDELIEVIEVVKSGPFTSPIIHTIALQLLAYHVAVTKGNDVDNPRNLAKSVTVE
ncbi:Glutamine--fructose-6-phosphate aminotransferase [isomerizing] [Geodia barretti]|uniref:Glutamine--fructose-6-phosphate aminotransferase [isomerizing] n=1 Tax=Geodia barretti TaxID=519541 RepID=A0AA35SZ90_GEOBA|nr:Glutamine--fructose-6-phosphate aminotransferase [isomerizing] [Geodia barretti]